jgi:pyruvate/2-oxoglutarate dehydrogenase complex dihydrolipoamide dehydrogenase (E3) component
MKDMPENYDVVVVGSGEAGKYLAWTMAKAGRRTALVERKLIGGSCPNIACLPSKNVIHSAKVASYFMRRSVEFGITPSDAHVDMAGVYKRKQTMVDGLVSLHLDRFRSTGVDLIMGEAEFVDERTVHVTLNAGGSRILTGDKLFLSLGTRSALPNVPGLADASPMTHIEALDLQRVPEHLIVLGAGYISLELAQAFRRFGSSVTIIERGPQIASKEDTEVGEALWKLFEDEGVDILLSKTLTRVRGLSGSNIEIDATGPSGSFSLQGTDLLIATGRVPNTRDIGLEKLGVEVDQFGYIKVDEKLETTAPHVWAVGDCAGSPDAPAAPMWRRVS